MPCHKSQIFLRQPDSLLTLSQAGIHSRGAERDDRGLVRQRLEGCERDGACRPHARVRRLFGLACGFAGQAFPGTGGRRGGDGTSQNIAIRDGAGPPRALFERDRGGARARGRRLRQRDGGEERAVRRLETRRSKAGPAPRAASGAAGRHGAPIFGSIPTRRPHVRRAGRVGSLGCDGAPRGLRRRLGGFTDPRAAITERDCPAQPPARCIWRPARRAQTHAGVFEFALGLPGRTLPAASAGHRVLRAIAGALCDGKRPTSPAATPGASVLSAVAQRASCRAATRLQSVPLFRATAL